MHIPDGFLSPPVALVTGLAAAGGVGLALSRLKPETEPALVPRMGLTAAYVFGAQMVNFPVAGGTSGHLLGALLAAVLLGPTAGTVVMAAVFLIQTFFFLDGGHTALGANVLNMGLAGTFGGYALYRACAGTAPGWRRCLVSTGIAAWFSVMLGALLTALQLALSGTVPARIVLPAMLGIHAVIGLGEAAITVAAVALLWRVRPDLLTGRAASGPGRWAWAAVAGLSLLALLAPLKSDFPDGLEWVAERLGFLSREAEPLLGGPFGDYTLPGLEEARWSAVLVSVIGAALMVGALMAVGALSRPRFNLAPARRLDARLQLAALLLLVLSAVLVPAPPAGRLWALFSLALAWTFFARVPLRWMAARLLVMLPFLGLVAFSAAFTRQHHLPLAGILLLRAATALFATAAFIRSVPEADALAAMHAYRMPRALVDTAAFALRYLRLIGEDAGRMIRARGARSAGAGTLALRAGAAGAIVGTLFIRSFERGERISIAMASRGFTGTMPEDSRQGFSAAEWLALAGFAAVLLGVWLWP